VSFSFNLATEIDRALLARGRIELAVRDETAHNHERVTEEIIDTRVSQVVGLMLVSTLQELAESSIRKEPT